MCLVANFAGICLTLNLRPKIGVFDHIQFDYLCRNGDCMTKLGLVLGPGCVYYQE